MNVLNIIKKLIKIEYAICWVVLLSFIDLTRADKTLSILAEADVSVFEANPDRGQAEETRHLLSAGIGRGLKEGRLTSYLRFDLSEIQDSTLFHYISIDSSKLSLLAQSFGLANSDERFFVTLNSCPDTTWDETKNELEHPGLS